MFKRRRTRTLSNNGSKPLYGSSDHSSKQSSRAGRSTTAPSPGGGKLTNNGLKSCLKKDTPPYHHHHHHSPHRPTTNSNNGSSHHRRRQVSPERGGGGGGLPSSPPPAGVDAHSAGMSAASSLGSVATSTTSVSYLGKQSQRLQFHKNYIREYERVLSDNPSCSSGAPVGLGWGYSKAREITIDEHEAQRQNRPRRETVDLVLTRQQREAILLEWGANVQEIIDAIRTNIRIKNRRRHTVNTIGRYDRWEEMMESAGRRLKRTILLQKPTSLRAQELSAQVQHKVPVYHHVNRVPMEMSNIPPPPPAPASSPPQQPVRRRSRTQGGGDGEPETSSSSEGQGSTMSAQSLADVSEGGNTFPGSVRREVEKESGQHQPLSAQYTSMERTPAPQVVQQEQPPQQQQQQQPQHHQQQQQQQRELQQLQMQQQLQGRDLVLMEVSRADSMSVDPNRPVSYLEVDMAAEAASVVSAPEDQSFFATSTIVDVGPIGEDGRSGIMDVSHHGSFSESSGDDGFEDLQRDTRHWAVVGTGGDEGPALQRMITPTVITEDAYMEPVYGFPVSMGGDGYYMSGASGPSGGVVPMILNHAPSHHHAMNGAMTPNGMTSVAWDEAGYGMMSYNSNHIISRWE